ncbi:MAG: VWA domain-containing protein [Alphaproteobacteria bacterium]
MRFATPEVLVLLIIPPLLWWWSEGRQGRGVSFPATGPLGDLPVSLRQRAQALLPVLRMLTLMLAILALARPQWGVEVTRIDRKGIAIAMVVDISTSMSALDLELEGEKTNRLDVVKATLEGFVEGDGNGLAGRDGDAIGIVTFARYADAISPPTLDHQALLSLLDDVDIIEIPDEDGTAIGDALTLGIDRLRQAGDVAGVLILLTDGSHNAGEAEPIEAAEVARALGIKIYAIGAGTRGQALMPVPRRDGGVDYMPTQVHIDEFVLKKIADATGGRYFRATDSEALRGIYEEIDRLEKGTNVVNYYQRYQEAFHLPLLAALGTLLLELLLATTWLRTLP